jgi:hypothetical protein
LITNPSQISYIKAEFSEKNLIEKTFLTFKKWV